MLQATRKIGSTNVPAMGWGAMAISAFYGEIQPDEERLKVMDRVFELGLTHWDTADVYMDSEDLLGKWFARTGKRSEIFLATKFGVQADGSLRGDAQYVREAVERSLKRLGVKQIDLYYPHRVDPNVPIEETVRAMAELVTEGKIKYIGLCEPSSSALRRAHAVYPISAVQVGYSLVAPDIEDPKIGLLATARELGIPIIAYSPMGQGALAGVKRTINDYDSVDGRPTYPRFSKENYPKTVALADDLKKIGERHNATAGQVSLAWLLAQGEDIIPLTGTRRIKYLEENVGAVKIKLSSDDVSAVRQAANKSGCMDAPRYPEFLMKGLFVDSPLPGKKV